MNDSEIQDMRDQIAKELNTDPMDGGLEMPDGGDGITRYPQDGAGGVIPPDSMPDYEEPEKGENQMSREMIDAIADGNNLDAENEFKKSIAQKVGDELELRRIELANTFVNTTGVGTSEED